jgi:hypothetical protein
MPRLKHIVVACVLALLTFSVCHASPPAAKKRSGNGTRINFGPVIGIYRLNNRHAASPSPRASVLAGFRREFATSRDYQVFILLGVDYFFHGLNFRSYYFAPDSVQIYDKSFRYNYSLIVHELNLPIQLKYLFRRADNSLFSPYAAVAYHLRYLLPGILKVRDNGALVKDDSPDVIFKTPFVNEKINAFVSVSLGWQKNSLSSSKGSFFAELNYRYGFSPYYFSTAYSASSLYINSSHLSVQLGFKF